MGFLKTDSDCFYIVQESHKMMDEEQILLEEALAAENAVKLDPEVKTTFSPQHHTDGQKRPIETQR